MAQYSNTHRPDVSFVWNITDTVLRGTFRKNEFGNVILPFVVLRRMDCILEPVNENVRAQHEALKEKLSMEKLDSVLCKLTGNNFYNVSRHTFVSLLDDAKDVSINFTNYLTGFNLDVQKLLKNFQFETVVTRLNRNNLLYRMIQEMVKLDFSLSAIDNHDMGYVYEEIIRIAYEQNFDLSCNHPTPRNVIRLISAILFSPDADKLRIPGTIRTIYDPVCGTGGMVNVGKRYILEEICSNCEEKPTIMTYGQEINEQTYAIAKSEALISGENADNITLGNTFTQDHFATKTFHYIMANLPFGAPWKNEQKFIINESLNPDGRFTAGTPRINDSQLLFVQHMISKMDKGGSRIGVVTTASPLFSGGAGSGESNIRKWLITNDWLECIVALPQNLFYGTGVYTYIWFFNNKKSEEREGKVQLINAVDFCVPLQKSIGSKRNDFTENNIKDILNTYLNFKEGENCRIIPNSEFGKYELTIEQPIRDDKGNIIRNNAGNPQPDTSKRDTEQISLDTNYKEFFNNEVLPYIDPDSWIDLQKTKTIYEINFRRYFYKFKPLEPSADIAKRIKSEEANIESQIKALFGNEEIQII